MFYSKKELMNEIAILEKENQKLITAIKRIDNKEQFETGKHYTRHYKKSIYRKIPFAFLDTVFYSQKDTLLKYANACFIEEMLDYAYENSSRRQNELVLSMPMYCNQIIKKNNGIVFILTDPYRTIATKPITKISDKSAEACKGRMLVANLVIPENHRAIKAFEMKGYRLLKMTLTNRFGKEHVKFDEIFTKFKDVTKEIEAIQAIKTIKNHYMENYECDIRKFSDTSLRILTETKLIGISYDKEKLWYAEQPSDLLLMSQTLKLLPRDENNIDYGQEMGYYCFVFKDETSSGY